jgi:hypothetical protein
MFTKDLTVYHSGIHPFLHYFIQFLQASEEVDTALIQGYYSHFIEVDSKAYAIGLLKNNQKGTQSPNSNPYLLTEKLSQLTSVSPFYRSHLCTLGLKDSPKNLK